MIIPADSPLNNPEVGYVDVTVRRGEFTFGVDMFPAEYSSVRIIREGLIVPTPEENEEENNEAEANEEAGYPKESEYAEEAEYSEENIDAEADTTLTLSQTEVAAASQTEAPEAVPALQTETSQEDFGTEITGEQFRVRFMLGDDRGNFRPNDSITRAEVAAMLVRTKTDLDVAAGSMSPNVDDIFSDVSANAWYAGYIAIAYSQGLLQGFPDGTFRPSQPISREEIAAMLARTGAVMEEGAMSYSDAGNVSGWASDYVYTVFATGMMQGDAAGTFRPREDITRAEAAATFARALGRGDTTAESIAGVDVHIFSDASNANAWHYFYVVDATNSRWFVNGDGVDIWTRVVN